MKRRAMFIAMLSFPMLASAKGALMINSIDWCPQLCSDPEKEGYVMDTVKKVFEGSPYEIKVSVFPWSRAIKGADSGKAHALLAPAKDEAPSLIYPNEPVGLQRMCFFTNADSDWRYEGVSSLDGKRFGIAADTSVEELNAYISAHSSQFEQIPYNSEYIKRSLTKLKKNRIEAFLFTYSSTVYEMSLLGVSSDFKEAGCASSAPIYLAFTPNSRHNPLVSTAMNYFDSRMKELHKSGEIDKIMKKYGLTDWSQYLQR